MTRTPDPNTEHLSTIAQILRDLHSIARSLLARDAVLESGAWQFDESGLVQREFGATYRAVSVWNQSTSDAVTVSSSTAGNAPPGGPGVVVVPAGRAAICNIAGRALTLYGVPDDLVVIEVFASTQSPAWG